jgi:hypothetical protein
MRRFTLAVCSIVLLSLVVSGFLATRASKQQLAEQVIETKMTGTVPGQTMRDMARRSAMIITGQCVETRTNWIERTLYTVATVSVGETIKGDPSSTVNVLLPGGIDIKRNIPVAMTFAGAPVMFQNDKVLLFLANSNAMPNSYSIMGFAQGKFTIVEKGGEPMVSPNQAVAPMNDAAWVGRSNAQMTRLSDFVARIREYLR